MLPTSVVVTDVTLRDGLQNEPEILEVGQKLRIAEALARTGVRSIEAGSFVRADLVPQLAGTGELFGLLPRDERIDWVALAPNQRGADDAARAGADEIRFVLSASDGHSRSNTGRSRDEGVRAIAEALARTREQSPGTRLTVALATAFVCPFDGRISPAELLAVVGPFAEHGVAALYLADTIGKASPREVTESLTAVRERYPELVLGLHLHDTYGRALANAWAGLGLGVGLFDSAVGGIGGCPFAPGAAGNVATEDLVELLHSCGIETGIDADRVDEANEVLATELGRPLSTITARARRASQLVEVESR